MLNLKKNVMKKSYYFNALFLTLALMFSGALVAKDASLKLYLPLDGTVEDMKLTDKVALTLVDNPDGAQSPNFVDEAGGAKLGQCLFFDADGHLPVYQTPTNFVNPNDGTGWCWF